MGEWVDGWKGGLVVVIVVMMLLLLLLLVLSLSSTKPFFSTPELPNLRTVSVLLVLEACLTVCDC